MLLATLQEFDLLFSISSPSFASELSASLSGLGSFSAGLNSASAPSLPGLRSAVGALPSFSE